MMTFKEYAHDKSKELIKNPTYAKIIEIVNDITTSTVNGRPITEEEINMRMRWQKLMITAQFREWQPKTMRRQEKR